MALLDKFSIQLFSVREETAKDFPGTIKKLGEIGYTGVEFAGYGDIPAKEMRKLLDNAGIASVGTHTGLERLTAHLDEEIEYNKILGTKYVILPWAEMKDAEGVSKLAADLVPIAEKLTRNGFIFGYHNHDQEFKQAGAEGQYLMDVLFANLPKNAVMELDMFWAAYAGLDAVAYMEKNKGLVKMLHLKQIKDMETKKCVDLNEGVLDFADIIRRAKAIGVEEFILEQEEFEVSPWISVKNGFDHIMGL